MSISIRDNDEHGDTVLSDLVGNIRASSYYMNSVILELDWLYTSGCEFAFITIDGTAVIGASNTVPITDTNGQEVEIPSKNIIIRKGGKWEMLVARKEEEYSFDDIN